MTKQEGEPMPSESGETYTLEDKLPAVEAVLPRAVLRLRPGEVTPTAMFTDWAVVEELNAQAEKLRQAEARIAAMEPFLSGWKDPDVTIVGLEEKLRQATAALERIASSPRVLAAPDTARVALQSTSLTDLQEEGRALGLEVSNA